MITKVISGGQTGADQAGLRAAKALGIVTGGWVPKGCRTDDGPAPWLVTEFGCTEHPDAGYGPRTVANVRSADVTLWFGDPTSPGARLTLGTCASDHRAVLKIPYLPADPQVISQHLDQIRRWFQAPVWSPSVINIAGNRERTNVGIGLFVERFVTALLIELA